MKRAVVTICSHARLDGASVLFDSIAAHRPDLDLFVVVVNDFDTAIGPVPRDATAISIFDLDLPKLDHFLFRYEIYELVTAIKPSALQKILTMGYDQVIYLDSDIYVFGGTGKVYDLLDGGASVVLTPHLLSPASPTDPLGDVGIMRHGIFNLGFIALRHCPAASALLKWWADHLERGCVIDYARGLFCDQKYIDLAIGLFEGVHVLRDPSFNVAYWNLNQRRLSGGEASGWLIDGAALSLFHFSGFSTAQPDRLSIHTHVFNGNLFEPLAELVAFYADKLQAAQRLAAHAVAVPFARFASGQAITPHVRRDFRDNHPNWPDNPFETGDWLLHVVREA